MEKRAALISEDGAVVSVVVSEEELNECQFIRIQHGNSFKFIDLEKSQVFEHIE